MIKRILLFTALFVIISLACGIPQQVTPTDSPDAIASAVAASLTAHSTAVQQSTPVQQQVITEVVDITTTQVSSDPTTGSPGDNTAIPTSETPSPTFTPTPTLTNTPTGGPKANLGDPDLKFTFNNGKEGFWDEDNEETKITAENGTLVQTATMNTTGWHGWSLHYHELEDFYLEAVVKTRTCSGKDEYGIVFRSPDFQTGYFYGISCDGKYNLRTLKGDYNTIISWTPAEEIQAGANQTNRFGVKAQDAHLALYANDKLLAEINDASFDKGTYGAFIAAYETANFSIEVDEIAYWILE